jgi:hypothetical protein
LCPIPGPEQYDEFQAAGLNTEPNLDRFDASVLTWRHPNLSKERLRSLLFGCYKQFYNFSETLRRIKKLNQEGKGSWARTVGSYRDSFFVRFAVDQGMHPMDGGIYRFRLDAAKDYQHLRRKYYDIDLAPMPKSLKLSAQDDAFNRSKRLVLPVLDVM